MQKQQHEQVKPEQNSGRREAPREDEQQGIEPRRPETMPRAEDDATTFANSPEFHDRVPKRD